MRIPFLSRLLEIKEIQLDIEVDKVQTLHAINIQLASIISILGKKRKV